MGKEKASSSGASRSKKTASKIEDRIKGCLEGGFQEGGFPEDRRLGGFLQEDGFQEDRRFQKEERTQEGDRKEDCRAESHNEGQFPAPSEEVQEDPEACRRAPSHGPE